MTPKQRAVAALKLQEPDDIVPTFELEFQLEQELLGRTWRSYDGLSGRDRDLAVEYNAQMWVELADTLDYSIIRTFDIDVIRRLKQEGFGEKYLLCGEADGTMCIPDGDTMVDLATDLIENPELVHERLSKDAFWAMEYGKRLVDAGAEMLTMCSDYCFNRGPFLSPTMFAEFVTPYLAQVIESHHQAGALVVKHTDGNIMPILDQIVSCKPNGLHSLDPQGGVEIAEVKRLYGDRLCLCGNVNCGLLQTGTDEEVRESALHSLRCGMPGGGYIYCTSNVAFKGLELQRYMMLMEIRDQHGRYPLAA